MKLPARFALLLVLLLASACRRQPPPPKIHAAPPTSRHVVLISIDGLPADVLPLPHLVIPNLRRLQGMGATAEGLTSVWPSVTYPAHATMVTGVRPAQHGITGNGPFDPTDAQHGAWHWYTRDLRARALWDAAREAGVSTGASYWPVTVGAAIDFNVPQIWLDKTSRDDALVRRHTTPPGLAEEIERHTGALPGEHRTDRERAMAAAHILLTRQPSLMLVYLTDLDSAEHKAGPRTRESEVVLERIDRELGLVIKATEAAGTFPRTTFIIVSDHGFRRVTKGVRPNVMLRDAGLLTTDLSGQVVTWRAAAHVAGGLAAIHVAREDDTEARDKVRAMFTAASKDPGSGIGAVYSPAEMARVGGFPGAEIVIEAAGEHTFQSVAFGPAIGKAFNLGNHGYPPVSPEMQGILVMAGQGVSVSAALGVVDMTSIAPTIARLLKLHMPAADGPVVGLL